MEDHLKEIEEIRRRKTQSLDPKLSLEIFKAWVRGELQKLQKQEERTENEELPF